VLTMDRPVPPPDVREATMVNRKGVRPVQAYRRPLRKLYRWLAEGLSF
jgi:hypothetical protein